MSAARTPQRGDCSWSDSACTPAWWSSPARTWEEVALELERRHGFRMTAKAARQAHMKAVRKIREELAQLVTQSGDAA